jgi:coenzyme F420-reducing hydrogenase beta subunit
MISFDTEGKYRFDRLKCCQCGACIAVCPVAALALENGENGLFLVKNNPQLCTNCHNCENVCPAHRFASLVLTESEWGKARSAFLAYSLDSNIRFSSSSGGFVRTIVRNALNSGFVDYAYCAVKSSTFPFSEGKYLSRNSDFLQIANSTYMSFPLLINCKSFPRGTRLLVVGTNCQLAGFDGFYEDSGIELVKIGLFCKQQKNIGYTRFLHKVFDHPFSCSTSVSYRGHGWPGCSQLGSDLKPYAKLAAIPFGKRLWNVPSCSYCLNALASCSADISVGDPWGVVNQKEAGGGMSLCIAFSQKGISLIDNARSNLSITTVDIGTVKKSVNWDGLQRHIKLASALSSSNASLIDRMRIKLLSFQTLVLESIFVRFRIPKLVQRIFARILPSE